jgi:hypothetical protein
MDKKGKDKKPVKKLLITLSLEAHKAAKLKALQQDMTLHDFVVEAIKEKTGAKK